MFLSDFFRLIGIRCSEFHFRDPSYPTLNPTQDYILVQRNLVLKENSPFSIGEAKNNLDLSNSVLSQYILYGYLILES